MQAVLPLFPLHTVLFPGGPLRLRIFEARYVDMIGRCMRENAPFGVALIVEGKEVGAAKTVSIGTTARIQDFERLRDGLLGISARGEQRFHIRTVSTQSDGLNLAQIELLAEEKRVAVPADLESMSAIMRSLYREVSMLYDDVVPSFEDASWLSSRLAELLPLDLSVRQACLEMDDPIERLRYLRVHIAPPAEKLD
jgi:Lon protease-like protein